MSRKTAREFAMQSLYEMDLQNEFNLEYKNTMAGRSKLLGRDMLYFNELFDKFLGNREAVDAQIEAASNKWKPQAMPRVDLAIARLAVTELLYMQDEVPASVAINEAVELAKKFGAEESSPSFINGLLGKLYKVNGLGEK